MIADCHLGRKWEHVRKVQMEPYERDGIEYFRSGSMRYDDRRGLEYVQSD